MNTDRRLALISAAALTLFVQPTNARPSRSSSIVLTPDEQTVCAANQDSGSVSLWDRSKGDAVREVVVGNEPRALAVSPGGDRLYVTTQCSQEMAVVDVRAGRCVARIPIGGQPVGVVLSPDGRRAYVAQYAGAYIDGKYVPGAVAVVDLAESKVTTRIGVKPRPFALAGSADGKSLYVTHYFHVDDVGLVTEIDIEALKVRREFTLAEDDDVISGRGGVFNALATIALHPQKQRAIVAGMHANVRRGMSQSGMPLSHKTTVQAVARILDLEAGSEMENTRIVSSFSGQAVAVPSAVAFLGNGEHFVDVYFASHDLKVIKYNERGLVAERSLLELPDGPTGVAVTRDGKTAFLNCRWARSVAEVCLADIRKPAVVREVRMTDEPWDATRILGARVFHDTRDPRMTPNRWLSCGVCHLDGGVLSDNLVWEFTKEQEPDSMRKPNTKTLALASWSSPPLFISGKSHSVQETDRFVHMFQSGSGFIAWTDGVFPEHPEGRSPDMDAVAAFVLAMRPRPNPHTIDGRPRPEIRASAERGRKLFFGSGVGCGHCHGGPYLTRSGRSTKTKLHDVGTGLAADTPSLLNLWETAPYLHDARARTLRDVLTTGNPRDAHGKTSHLSEQEITDLVHFMLAPAEEGSK